VIQKQKPNLPANTYNPNSKIKIITERERSAVRDFVPVKRGGLKLCSFVDNRTFVISLKCPQNTHLPYQEGNSASPERQKEE